MLTRRLLVSSLAATSLPSLRSFGQTATPGMIIRQKEPENLETPFESASSFVTPNGQFYIRSHFAVPAVDAGAWRIRIEGEVERPLDLTLSDLAGLPQQTRMATLECAGNGRVFLAPAAPGVQWELGAVSNAEWTGVPLSAVLERAGVKAGAREVILEGADSGEIRTDPHPNGPIHYARSLPLGKAMKPEVLLALKMNGAPLPLSHGAPVRCVVSGWYGMASVKWLNRIQVVNEPFQGYHQTIDYAWWDRSNGLQVRRPLADMQVKSAIARPGMNELVTKGQNYRVYGAAWTGDSDITKVEVSADGGQTWNLARLGERGSRFTWRLWEYDWKTPSQSGRVILMARATDSQGKTQPSKHNADYANYAIHHTLPISVDVA